MMVMILGVAAYRCDVVIVLTRLNEQYSDVKLQPLICIFIDKVDHASVRYSQESS
jgi:hypothetical protein